MVVLGFVSHNQMCKVYPTLAAANAAAVFLGAQQPTEQQRHAFDSAEESAGEELRIPLVAAAAALGAAA